MSGIPQHEADALAAVMRADVEEQNRALAWTLADRADKVKAVKAAGMHPEMALFPLDRFTAQQRADVCAIIGQWIRRLEIMQIAMGIGLEAARYRAADRAAKRLAELEAWAAEAFPSRGLPH